MRSIVLYVTLLVILFISPITVTVAAPAYEMTVFSPNNVIYDIKISGHISAYNTSAREYVYDLRISINGSIMLVSKRLDLNHYAWGANVSISYVVKENNTITSQAELQVPVPPILAVKVGTRKIYLTQIILDVLGGGLQNTSFSEIIRRLPYNKPVPGFYIYNPFYIPINSGVGDKIPYGVYNETAKKGLIINGTIAGEDSVSVPEGTFSAWVVKITAQDILEVIELINGVPIDLPPSLDFGVDFYYEKRSGWLLKVVPYVLGSSTGNSDLEVSTDISGGLTLEKSGTVMVGGRTLIDKIIGLPAYTTFVIVGVIMAVVLVYVVRRRY
ncbi:MAG: hypothetical protein ACTSX9_03340 [Candidatus Njordarchaeales archaeon]